MTQANPPPETHPQRTWGYFVTLGWAVIAYIVASTIGFSAMLVVSPERAAEVGNFEAMLKDGWFFSFSTLVTTPILVGILMVAARLAGWTATGYLALVWPKRRDTVIALVTLAVFLPVMDAVSYLLGQPVVTQFQIDIYVSAQKAGTLLLLWLALVVAAPIGEEVTFRGFLFRGWVRPATAAMPAIVVIAAFFAVLHIQYNWFGILQVFAIGFILTWFRWVSGSTLLTIFMHAIVNFYSTVQTVVVLNWQS
jgi:membrane protease YdiL (CAAX protease family)